MILTFVTWFNVQSFQHVEIQRLNLMVIFVNAEKVFIRLHLVACQNAFMTIISMCSSHIVREGIVP